MTASAAFDVIFVGAGHNVLIPARNLAENSGSVCLLDQRPIPVKPHTAPSESFMDDPEDFKKRSGTGSPYEDPTSPNTYWLCGRLLRMRWASPNRLGHRAAAWIAGERGVSSWPV